MATNPIVVSSFAAALWLVAKGFEPVATDVEPTRGTLQFTFPVEARKAWESYHDAKYRLQRLGRQAREW